VSRNASQQAVKAAAIANPGTSLQKALDRYRTAAQRYDVARKAEEKAAEAHAAARAELSEAERAHRQASAELMMEAAK